MKTNCRKHTSENEQLKIIFLATFKCNIVFGKKQHPKQITNGNDEIDKNGICFQIEMI